MQEASGRIFIDLNPVLRYRRLRHLVPRALPLADERIARAVADFRGREEYRAALPPEKRLELASVLKAAPFLLSVLAALLFRNLGRGLDKIERAMADRIAEWRRRSEEASGPERVKRVRTMLRALFSDLVGMRALQNVLPGVIAFPLIGSLSRRWLGDAAELATLGRSPRGNVTTEMGLALGDVADVVRADPGAIEFLRRSPAATLDDLREIAGGKKSIAPSRRSSSGTACGARARSTSPGRVGARPRRSSSPPSRDTCGAVPPGSTPPRVPGRRGGGGTGRGPPA